MAESRTLANAVRNYFDSISGSINSNRPGVYPSVFLNRERFEIGARYGAYDRISLYGTMGKDQFGNYPYLPERLSLSAYWYGVIVEDYEEIQ
jgi:hypothetical protein